ncbi:MAG: hypothetical protein ACFE9R_06425 [Candidatus Hermodarchaeota archaeon]
MKSKSVLTRGILPSLQLKQTGLIAFLIVADYGEHLRAYQFSRQAVLIAADNIEPTAKLIKQIQKTTTLTFQLPKKESITHPKDLSALLQEIFQHHLSRINHLLSTKVSFPYTITINPYQKVNLTTHTFGCTIKGNRFEVPSNVLVMNLEDIIPVRAIFYQYLSTMILINDKRLKPIFNDLAIIFTYIYNNLRNKKLLLEALNPKFTYLINNKKESFTNLAIEVLKSKKEQNKSTTYTLSRSLIQNIFHNIDAKLSLLSKYKITLDPYTLYGLFRELFSEIKIVISTQKLDSFRNKNDIREFFTKVFKDTELEFIFNTPDVSELPLTKTSFENITTNYQKSIAKLKSSNQIGELSLLVSDFALEPLFDRLISIELYDKFDQNYKTWNLKLVIRNIYNYPIYKVSFKLSWHPKSRISRQNVHKDIFLEKFDSVIELSAIFDILNWGQCTLTITISFLNPLFPKNNFSIKKDIQYQFTKLESKIK